MHEQSINILCRSWNFYNSPACGIKSTVCSYFIQQQWQRMAGTRSALPHCVFTLHIQRNSIGWSSDEPPSYLPCTLNCRDRCCWANTRPMKAPLELFKHGHTLLVAPNRAEELPRNSSGSLNNLELKWLSVIAQPASERANKPAANKRRAPIQLKLAVTLLITYNVRHHLVHAQIIQLMSVCQSRISIRFFRVNILDEPNKMIKWLKSRK